MRKAGLFAALAMVAGVGSITIGSAGLASASPGTPVSSSTSGNNGTIKIDGVPLLDPGQGDEANHPHVSCELALTFFGFDAAPDTAVVQFSAQPPSGSFTPVAANGSPTNTIHFTPASRQGNTLDASVPYTLDVSGLTAQPKQGYHIKVSVEVTTSQGSDDKSKVFWYEPCTPPATTTTTSTTTTTTTTTTTLPLLPGSGGLGCAANCGSSCTSDCSAPATTLPPTGGRGRAPLTSPVPQVSAGQSRLLSGQAPDAAGPAAAGVPMGAATDLGFFKPGNWAGSAPWLLMIVAGVLLLGTGIVGLRYRRI